VGAGVAGKVRVVLPAQTEIECQMRTHAPVVLHVAGDVTVEDGRDRHRNDRRAAFESDRDWDVEIVDLAVAVQVGKAEVGGENDRTGAKDIDFAVSCIVLEFAADAQRVLAQRPGERIAKLISAEVCGLGQIEVFAIGKVGKDQLVGQAERGRVGGGLSLPGYGGMSL
jgi:hypothetical protein